MTIRDKTIPMNQGALCNLCPLFKEPLIQGEGPEKTAWAVVGESPGWNEFVQGRPFVGPSGQITDAILGEMGLDRKQILVTNAVQCYPGRVTEKGTVDMGRAAVCCRPRLINELRGREVNNVVSLGAIALTSLERKAVGITEEEGRRRTTADGFTVYPTFHPAYCLRAPETFQAVSRSVDRWKRPKRTVPSEIKYTLIDDKEKLMWLRDRLYTKTVALDLESESLDVQHARILCVALYDGREWFIIPEEIVYDHTAQLKETLLTCSAFFLNHNFKFDRQLLLKQLGISLYFEYDTMLGDYALREAPWGHSLKDIAEREWELEERYESEIEALKPKGAKKKLWSYRNIPLNVLYHYACLDVYFTWELFQLQKVELKAEGLWSLVMTHLVPLQNLWADLEFNGFTIDADLQRELKERYAKITQKTEDEIRYLVGLNCFNPRSPKQVKELLFSALGLQKPSAKGNSKIAQTETGKAVLEAIKDQHPVVPLLLDHRKATKTEGYLKLRVSSDGRMYPEINVGGTKTGRLSATGLVNIPREGDIKKLFCARPGHVIVQADYKQAELITLANITQDPFLIDTFLSGRDIHTEVARVIERPRVIAKNVNFGIVYSGGDAKAIAYTTGLSVDVVEEIVATYFAKAPKVKEYILDVYGRVQRDGYIQTIFGRKRRFPLITPDTWPHLKNEAVNFECQSVASDLTQRAVMVLALRGLRVIYTVHDSIILECKESEVDYVVAMLREVMIEEPKRYYSTVPYGVDISVGPSWGELEEWVTK